MVLRHIIIFTALALWGCIAYAQDAVNLNAQKIDPHPRDVKILSEYKDKAGNTIRTVQYAQGVALIKETIIIPKKHYARVYVPIRPDTIKKDQLTVQISKSQYFVAVFYRKKMIRAYKAVFGPCPQKNKCMEGDRCTPEGWFTISMKNANSQYHKFLALDYPNDSSYAQFNRLKQSGLLPPTARIGGSVGIHGIWPNGDDMIELGVGWTDGCVAVKNKDIDDLYSLVSVGTKVQILK